MDVLENIHKLQFLK